MSPAVSHSEAARASLAGHELGASIGRNGICTDASCHARPKTGDGPPPQGLREVYADQHRLLVGYEGRWQALVKGDLARLNGLARKLELPVVLIPPPNPRGGKDTGKTR